MSSLPKAETTGRCPACQNVVRFERVTLKCEKSRVEEIGGQSVLLDYMESINQIEVRDPSDKSAGLFDVCMCPACRQPCIVQCKGVSRTLVLPGSSPPKLLPDAVDPEMREEFAEAARVLPISPKASAALARRCLEMMLTKQGFYHPKLEQKIEAAEQHLPGYLHATMDAVRKLGNLSVHAQESKHTGEIVDVEPHEADLLLTILEELADHYYVKPAASAKRLADLQAKLQNAKRLTPGQQTPPKPAV